jgi:hypothetical protein
MRFKTLYESIIYVNLSNRAGGETIGTLDTKRKDYEKTRKELTALVATADTASVFSDMGVYQNNPYKETEAERCGNLVLETIRKYLVPGANMTELADALKKNIFTVSDGSYNLNSVVKSLAPFVPQSFFVDLYKNKQSGIAGVEAGPAELMLWALFYNIGFLPAGRGDLVVNNKQVVEVKAMGGKLGTTRKEDYRSGPMARTDINITVKKFGLSNEANHAMFNKGGTFGKGTMAALFTYIKDAVSRKDSMVILTEFAEALSNTPTCYLTAEFASELQKVKSADDLGFLIMASHLKSYQISDKFDHILFPTDTLNYVIMTPTKHSLRNLADEFKSYGLLWDQWEVRNGGMRVESKK